MTELAFMKVPVPAAATTRAAAPNPFAGHFPADDEALQLQVDGPKDSAEVKKLASQARKAASAVDRSARFKAEESSEGTGKAKKTVTVITVWTVAKISRKTADSK